MSDPNVHRMHGEGVPEVNALLERFNTAPRRLANEVSRVALQRNTTARHEYALTFGTAHNFYGSFPPNEARRGPQSVQDFQSESGKPA